MQSLSYPSLQCVLQYMDPNLRVQVSLCCPSIQAADSSTPRKIDSLELNEYEITVNDTKYSLGLIKKYPADVEISNLLKTRNNEGGEKHDVDKFGLEVGCGETTPGDIVVEGKSIENEEERRKNEMRLWNRAEKVLEHWKKMEMQNEELNIGGVMRASTFDTTPLLEYLLPYRLKYSDEYRNAEVPFKHYIQLLVHERHGDDWILQRTEVLDYNQKLCDSMKYMASRLLGKSILKTSTFQITPDIQKKCCFRLPENLRITTDHLKIKHCRQAVLYAFRPVLHGSLKVFEELGKPSERNYYNDPIVSTSRRLIVFQSEGNFETSQVIHKRVHSNLQPGPGVVNLINSWIEDRRDIGTHYSYDFTEIKMTRSVMSSIENLDTSKIQILKKNGGLFKCGTIPMTTNGQIVVFVQRAPGANNSILHFKVYPKEYSTIS